MNQWPERKPPKIDNTGMISDAYTYDLLSTLVLKTALFDQYISLGTEKLFRPRFLAKFVSFSNRLKAIGVYR